VNGQSGGWNKTGITLAVLAVWEFATRDSLDPLSHNQEVVPVSPVKHFGTSAESPENVTSSSTPPAVGAGVGLSWLDHWSLSSLGLGGLIFSLHCLLADSGTLVAFAWSGYPIKGPVPGFHDFLILIAAALGIIVATSRVKRIVRHPVWMIFGVVSTYFVYRRRDWHGFIAGSFLALFLSSLIPEIIRNAALHGKKTPGKVYFTAWLVVCLFDLANVWTVAYAFVPAGWLLRERTDMWLFYPSLPEPLG